MPDLDVSAAIKEALARYRAGDLARAEQVYRAIVAAAPDALHYADLAIVLEAQGKYEEAAATYQEAMRRNPREARPHYNLGNLLRDRGRIDEAIACFQQAIALNPRYADAYNNLGRLLVERGRLEESMAHFRQTIALAPGFAHGHNNLGTALHSLGRLEEAIRCYRRAIELKPDYAEAYSNLGSAHLRLDQLDAAIENCRKAANISPAFPDVHYNLANACRSALLMAEAIEHYERAISLRPDYGGYHWNYSMAMLLNGDYAKGWREYEWRWQGCLELKSGKPAFSRPEWKGEDLSGQTVLLYREQGLGDVIQFIRYAPMVAGRGARVVVACQPELIRLLGAVDGVFGVVSIEQPLPPFDMHCPLLSLPLIFNTTLATIPSGVPYMSADGALTEAWRKRIGPDAAFKVGLIWGGWAGNQIDARRSIPLADFAPLARLPGVTFYSLQKGQHAAQSPPAGMSLIDWSGELTDFADTAALVDNLDLVISVDTAGAHLAGAMGKQVWLLNRFESEWRWLLEREDSPWYPSMRIFRQPRPGDWRTVMAKVREALERRAS
jgi:tetratricopeptide (TPR) repeat protein